jgi:hypothetical protein
VISPSQALPINYRSTTWVTIGNFSQYFFVKDHSGAIDEKLGSGQPLRGIGVFGRIGYAPEETNPVTRDGSVALIANGLSDDRPNDSWARNLSQWNQSTLKGQYRARDDRVTKSAVDLYNQPRLRHRSG